MPGVLPTTASRRILRYIGRFGLGGGLQAAQLHRRPGSIVTVRLPGMPRSVWVRTSTSDVETFEEVFVGREYDLPFDDFEPGRILDLGANVGYASIAFSARWPEARILAVEPDDGNFRVLKRNIGEWPNIASLRAAVWSRAVRVRIANPEAASNAFRMSEAADSPAEGIPALTVEQIADRLGWERMDLVKIDVEGAEAELFRGDTAWLDRVGILVIELHDRIVPSCAEAFYGALQGRRFRQEIVGQNLAIDFRR